MTINCARSAVVLAAVGALGMGGLTACSGSKAVPAASAASVSATAAGSSGQRGSRGAVFADPKVRQCLNAAGISLPTRAPGARPSGSVRPSFTGAPPGGVRPSGGGGFFNSGQNSKIEQALKACGITIPARGSGSGPGTRPAGGTATPSASPSGG